MTVSINNIHSGGGQNFSGGGFSGIGSGQAGTISTNGDGQIVVLIIATARTDTTSGTTISKVGAISASGLTFVEVTDRLTEFNVGGSFPYTNWHLQVFAAPALAQLTNLSWGSSLSGGGSFANQQSCIGFAVAGIGDYTKGFDGDVAAALATSFFNSNTDTSLEQPTVNLTTSDANTLLLSIFLDSVSDGSGAPAVFTAGTGKTAIANVASTRQYAVGNLFAQYETVTSAQAAVAQEPAASTRKFWKALTLAFTESGTTPPATVRITQEAAEVLHTGVSNVRITQEAAEVLHTGVSNVRISFAGVEVLRTVAVGAPPSSSARPIVCVVT